MGRVSFIDKASKSWMEGGGDPGPLLAHLYRESHSLADGLRRWAAERPPVPDSYRGLDGIRGSVALSGLVEAALKAREEARRLPLAQDGIPIVPSRDLLPPDALDLLAEPGGLERLSAAFPEGSPGRQSLETLRAKIEAHQRANALSRLVDPVAMEVGRKYRVEVADKILQALGDGETPDFVAARMAVKKWQDDVVKAKNDRIEKAVQESRTIPPSLVFPQQVEFVFGETFATVLPLIVAFENPGRFFCKVIPSIFPREMERPIEELLVRWGFGVLLNADAYGEFREAARRPGFSALLSKIEDRGRFEGDGGRPKGSKDTPGKSKRLLTHDECARTASRVRDVLTIRSTSGKIEVSEKKQTRERLAKDAPDLLALADGWPGKKTKNEARKIVGQYEGLKVAGVRAREQAATRP